MRLMSLVLMAVLLSCSCSTIQPKPQFSKKLPKPTNQPSMVSQVEADGELRILHLDGAVTEASSKVLIAQIEQANEDASVKYILIEINSPGGSVDAGLLVSKAIERSTTAISCVVDGDAASMAFYILQSCPKRMMTKRSMLMIHGPGIAADFAGKQDDWQNVANLLKTAERAIIEHLVARMDISADELEKRIAGGAEVWLGWREAKKMQAVDIVVDSFPKAKVEAQR